jgi:hypothetical protein
MPHMSLDKAVEYRKIGMFRMQAERAHWVDVWRKGDERKIFVSEQKAELDWMTMLPNDLREAPAPVVIAVLGKDPSRDFLATWPANERRMAVWDNTGTPLLCRINKPGGTNNYIAYIEDPKFDTHDPQRFRGHFWVGMVADPEFPDSLKMDLDADSVSRLRQVAELLQPGVLASFRPNPFDAIAAKQREQLGETAFRLISEAAEASDRFGEDDMENGAPQMLRPS